MPDYKAMYYRLLRAQAQVVELFQQAHRDAEDLYIHEGELLRFAPKNTPGDEPEE